MNEYSLAKVQYLFLRFLPSTASPTFSLATIH